MICKVSEYFVHLWRSVTIFTFLLSLKTLFNPALLHFPCFACLPFLRAPAGLITRVLVLRLVVTTFHSTTPLNGQINAAIKSTHRLRGSHQSRIYDERDQGFDEVRLSRAVNQRLEEKSNTSQGGGWQAGTDTGHRRHTQIWSFRNSSYRNTELFIWLLTWAKEVMFLVCLKTNALICMKLGGKVYHRGKKNSSHVGADQINNALINVESRWKSKSKTTTLKVVKMWLVRGWQWGTDTIDRKCTLCTLVTENRDFDRTVHMITFLISKRSCFLTVCLKILSWFAWNSVEKCIITKSVWSVDHLYHCH